MGPGEKALSVPMAVAVALRLPTGGALPTGIAVTLAALAAAVLAALRGTHGISAHVRFAGVCSAKPWQAEALPLLANAVAATLRASLSAIPISTMLLLAPLSVEGRSADAGADLIVPAAMGCVAVRCFGQAAARLHRHQAQGFRLDRRLRHGVCWHAGDFRRHHAARGIRLGRHAGRQGRGHVLLAGDSRPVGLAPASAQEAGPMP
mmetsp:Transcript_69442/g.165508  ORF Transcript_69442/g.165508 Transcript_69442/m.165508 type:complete len:206 (+) Transcript_69442:122-739(+)